MLERGCPCYGSTLDRLLRPALLCCIAQEPQHGYRIAQRLQALRLFRRSSPDLAGLYRCLRELEDQGLVESERAAPARGKARRRFSLTRDGLECVRQWDRTLADYAAGLADLRRRLRVVAGRRSR
jgi:DNA-binding PadR family transcriptional regulator